MYFFKYASFTPSYFNNVNCHCGKYNKQCSLFTWYLRILFFLFQLSLMTMANSTDLCQIKTDDGQPDWSAINTRLDSYRTFPTFANVPVERLARAGFYFTGESDRVRCFSCLHTVENWHQGDNPVERHQSVSPHCKFLSCVHSKSLVSETSSQMTVSIYNEEEEAMEYRLRTGEVVDESTYPMIPHMKSEDARLRTFSNWPSWSPVQAHDLAQAGMFYVPDGESQIDTVKCFCCGGMLGSWEEGDDPWQEHAKVYSNCFFILGHDVGNIPSKQPRQRNSGHGSSMDSFGERLQSLRNKDYPISHERLARAGFFGIGKAYFSLFLLYLFCLVQNVTGLT